MAKLNAPLFSFAASGKIANALVYFTWKGLNVVRQYVVPANPQSDPQILQRGYMKAAVPAIHTAQGLVQYALVQRDLVAYALKGSTYPTPRTWFNQICKFWFDTKVAAKIPTIHASAWEVNKAHDAARVSAYHYDETPDTLAAGRVYLGTSPTALVKSKPITIAIEHRWYIENGDEFDDLEAGVKYYWQMRPNAGDGCAGGDSGIYHFKAT